MARKGSAIQRGKPRFRPQPTILVICEDLKSGRTYLQEANQYFRANFHIEITHCGHTDPKGIVAEALRRAKQYDRVICVIDRDAHANFDAAIQLAKSSSKVEIADSHPCFEYWLLLHFKYTRKPYAAAGRQSAADVLIAELCDCPGMSSYAKGNIKGLFSQLLGDTFNTARERAPRALADALDCGDFNPSTRLHELISLMEKMSQPVPMDSQSHRNRGQGSG